MVNKAVRPGIEPTILKSPSSTVDTEVRVPLQLGAESRVKTFMKYLNEYVKNDEMFSIRVYEPVVKTGVLDIDVGYKVKSEEGEFVTLRTLHLIDPSVVSDVDTYLNVTHGRMFKYTVAGDDGLPLTYLIPIKTIMELSNVHGADRLIA